MVKYYSKKTSNSKKGFTLLELAIVISVVTFLMSNVVLLFDSSVNIYKEKKNRERLAMIKTAMSNYFVKNLRLPCPSNPFLEYTNAQYGSENLYTTSGIETCVLNFNRATPTTGEAPLAIQVYENPDSSATFYLTLIGYDHLLFGGVPVRTLGLPSEMAFDTYGNAFTFVVPFSMTIQNRYSKLPNTATSTTYSTLANTGYIKYHTSSGIQYSLFTNTTGNNFIDIMYPKYSKLYDVDNREIGDSGEMRYFVISHGSNGYGAWKKDGTINPLNPDTNALENKNSYLYYETACNGYTSSCPYSNGSQVVSFYQGQKNNVSDDVIEYDSLFNLIQLSNFKNAMHCSSSMVAACYNTDTYYSRSHIYGITQYGESFLAYGTVSASPKSVDCQLNPSVTYTCDVMGNLY